MATSKTFYLLSSQPSSRFEKPKPMDINEFRLRGKEMVEYICDFMSNIHRRRVTPDVGPGYLRPLLPSEAPNEGEPWEDIMSDVENKIMPGITHWQHPRFHAYFPAGNSFPSILGDMLSDGIGCIGFSWAASPACTELETIVCDWFGKAMALPKEFLYFSPGSRGGGVIQVPFHYILTNRIVLYPLIYLLVCSPIQSSIVIHAQGSASESVLVCMLAARTQAITRLKESPVHAHLDETTLLGKLMAYCSRESHSCAEKDAMICFVKLRILEPDEKSVLRGETLQQAMESDVAEGLIQFQPETPKKGKDLAEAGRVLRAVEHLNNNNSYLLECKIIRQTDVSSALYTPLNYGSMLIEIL
ncbi:hypothetical protein PV328_007710 [Microctonus aethiopoides]|uniref:Tyrosine decarboxylase n=1 Tax=Microctonus aethiopoides TaxID=144406 RepID=A0AA39C9A2_9HYME|nr:hypothetical protein PV328_007710 [Microctonus aethiopoides]